MKTNKAKHTVQRTKKMIYPNHTKILGWTQAPTKDTQILPLIRHQPCYSHSQDVFDITMSKQLQITLIKHKPSYKHLGQRRTEHHFYVEILADITTRS